MVHILGPNRYGKAETRVVRVDRYPDRHEITDLTVSIALAGDLADAHLRGDNRAVLPTDSQKNTVYAFAQQHGVGEPERFALRLARHFVDSQPAIGWARVAVTQHRWQRLELDGAPAPHSFVHSGAEARQTTVTCTGSSAWVVSGLTGLVVLNTTGSEFTGFARDRYTTLADATDRILATAVDAQWRHADLTAGAPDRTDGTGGTAGTGGGADAGTDWKASHAEVRQHLLAAFAGTHSLSLQHTLYSMGSRVLDRCPEVAEIRLTLPNRHHLPVDLSPFGQSNSDEVFVATDRPYGLIEGGVLRAGVPAAPEAW